MDWLKLLQQAVDAPGASQATVARKLDYNPSVVSQALRGLYGTDGRAGDLDTFAAKVVEVYGDVRVTCPVLGSITLARCAAHQQREFSSANPLAVDLWATCPNCKHNTSKRR